MAPHSEDDKVRPIEYVPDDSSISAPGGYLQSEPEHRSKRPWLALASSAVAVLMIVGAVSVFGALEFTSSQPAPPDAFSGADDGSQSPDDTLPPRLQESLPYVTDRLTLVARIDNRLQTLLWDPSFRLPRPYDLPIRGIASADMVHASFDRGGRTLAVTLTTDEGSTVYLGEPTDIGTAPDLTRVSSAIWHASEVGAISWTVPMAGGGVELHTAKVNPLSGSISNDVVITTLDGSARLVHWDSAGFVLDTANSTLVVTRWGEAMWTHPGLPTSASASIVTTIVPDQRERNTRWLVLDRRSGEPTGQTMEGPPGEIWVANSRETDLIAEIFTTDNVARILVHGKDLGPRRMVNVAAPVVPIGFSAQTEYLQFSVRDSNDIVFVNWRTGVTHTVPIPDEYEIIGIDLG